MLIRAGKCITPGSHYKLLLAYIFSSGYISLGDNNPGKNLPVTLDVTLDTFKLFLCSVALPLTILQCLSRILLLISAFKQWHLMHHPTSMAVTAQCAPHLHRIQPQTCLRAMCFQRSFGLPAWKYKKAHYGTMCDESCLPVFKFPEEHFYFRYSLVVICEVS